MAVTVVIPAGPDDALRAQRLARGLKGASETLVMGGGTAVENRNAGARKARYDELVFLDADMAVPDVDLSSLDAYGHSVATALFVFHPDDHLASLAQNFAALAGHPLAYYGGFMYARKAAFEEIGPFREMPSEDVEWAQRAWLKGFEIGTFPFRVYHTQRRLGIANHLGPIYTQEGAWGIP